MYLVDLAQKARAEAVLRVWLRQYPSGGRQGHPLEQGIQVRKGDYDFLQLLEWRHRARSLFSLSDVIFLDVDEQRNRVAIGVRNITALQPIIRELANQGIPREAVIFEESGPARPRTTLQDRERPTAGGLRINRLGDGCTLGFNAYAGGVKTFVTNSHCTTVRSEPDNTDFFQVNLDSSADYIGRETADPPFFTGGACPSGRKCRYSDAALVGYSEPAGSEWDFGGIARPITFDPLEGPIEIDAANPRFRIFAEQPHPIGGAILEKVGITTGWTVGSLVASCQDVSVSDPIDGSDTGITLLCQEVVDAGNKNGDSGSPVFLWDGIDGAKLYGILWGGFTATRYVFSAMDAVELELGALTTF